MTRAGVGYSEDPDSTLAGSEAARAALEDGRIDRADLVLLFSTEKHDPVRLRDGVRSVVGSRPRLLGGYSMGIATRDHLGYDGFQVGVAALSSDSVRIDAFIQEGILDNEYAAGIALGDQIARRTFEGAMNILLMYDAVKRSAAEGLALNLATPLLAGMTASLGTWPAAAGLGMFGSMAFNPTFQWFEDRITQHSAMALVLSGGVRMDTLVLHGCRPSGAYHTITKVDGNAVLEIDGRPARDVIADLLGDPSGWEDYPLLVTLGVNRGDKFGAYREEDYATRLVMAVDKARGALVMFETALTTGTELQLMRRSVDFAYVTRRVADARRSVAGRRPFFALYIDCGARAGAYCGMEQEDAAEVQRAIGDSIPLLGVYSGVEIAKVGGELQALNFTGVLLRAERVTRQGE